MEIAKNKKFIGVFLLAMLNLSVMASVRNLPLVAEYGYLSAFYYLLVAFAFLIPVALISAELASGWCRSGGVYDWVKEAFGPNWGFFAIWMQWIHNVTWFPAILSFSSATLAYMISPSLATNKLYLICSIVAGFWAFTIFNYFGLKRSSWFSAVGVIGGTLLPGLVLILLGVSWVARGNPVQLTFSWGSLIPHDFDLQSLSFLTGLFLAFAGLEVSAAYVRSVQHPQRSYPKAIAIAGALSLVLYVFGALSIAYMIPRSKISLVKGVMDAFTEFFADFGLSWLVIPMGILIVWGAVAELNAWIIGPVRALHTTTKHGDLPPIFQKLNAYNSPFNLLVFQGFIVTLASFAFLFMPNASSAFWILSVMSAQLYLIMYFLMFLAAIKLRYSHPNVERPYRVPFGKGGIWIFGILGCVSSLLGFLMGFVPPSQLKTGDLLFFEGFLIIGLIFMCAIPYIIYHFRHPGWKPESTDDEEHHPSEHLHS